ncbi:glucosaminidase domain-containing protein [Paenibacillus sinopodophylli]|uniref:glucosaminidase domain-containing protein n=1 Tax=Paenibacillus sinopodophylli TaxID=1837342 RepID=UPI00110C98C3|nr:glucosaminidase domain-containing protein [Paenibacillus sinopodophylli]
MQAEEAYVLSPTDVRNIRSYVQHKYAALPQDEHVEIVADAVKRIIHKQLPNFDSSLKQMIAEKLIRDTILEKQRPLRAEDILVACWPLDRTDMAIYGPLHEWVEQQLAISCERPLMQRIMNDISAHMDQLGKQGLAAEKGVLAHLKVRLVGEGVVNLHDALVQAQMITLPQSGWSKNAAARRRLRNAGYGFVSLCLIAASLLYGWSLSKPSDNKLQPPAAMQPAQSLPNVMDGLPAELRYHAVDEKRLVAYLQTKSSVLAKQPYFGAIVDAAKSFDIHPVILFAITGQEQGFVPVTNKQHLQIANNPFNVFHSWQEFNTDIKQSAEIASRTIARLSKDRPAETDPFQWINREYAEDPNWSNGVRSIFNTIIAYLESPAHP